MNATDVLSMYENIAGLTNQMVVAARAGDWNDLGKLEGKVAIAADPAEDGLPALAGSARQRKIDLLKQILANDRAIRDVTEAWTDPLAKAMQAH